MTCARTFEMLTVALSEFAMNRTQVQLWYNRFKKDRENVNDNAYPGSPSTSTTDVNIEAVNKMILDNRPNDISSAADNAIFKNRAQNIKCSFGCVAHSAVLLKPIVVNILLFNFWEQKFVEHGPITIAIDCNDLSLLIFKEKWPNYVSGPKSAPNNDSFGVRRLFNACVRVFCAPNATIMLFYIPAKIKISLSEKMIIFAKIDIFCKSIAGPLSEAYASVYRTIFVRRKNKTNYLWNKKWAKCYHSRNKH